MTALARLDYDALRDEWRRLFGTEPPLYGKELLRQRVAYRIQELAYGGLPDATRERLRSIVEPPPKATPGPVCGAILVRVFKGMRHEVTVLADGFQFQGRHWKSLSAIAKAIVGSQRDGPLFFGLRKKVRRRHA